MFRHHSLGRALYKLQPVLLPTENEGEKQLGASVPSKHLEINPAGY